MVLSPIIYNRHISRKYGTYRKQGLLSKSMWAVSPLPFTTPVWKIPGRPGCLCHGLPFLSADCFTLGGLLIQMNAPTVAQFATECWENLSMRWYVSNSACAALFSATDHPNLSPWVTSAPDPLCKLAKQGTAFPPTRLGKTHTLYNRIAVSGISVETDPCAISGIHLQIISKKLKEGRASAL